MKKSIRSHGNRFLVEEHGQVLPWMVFLIILFLGMAGLTLDLGHAYVSYRELQASTDAAALAGAYAMTLPMATASDVKAAATAASSKGPAGANMNVNLPNAEVYPTLECLPLATVGVPCVASSTNNNVIQVVQTADVPTFFIRALAAFGVNSAKSITLTATSTAVMAGATNKQYNVAIVLDSTGSMSSRDNDASCNNTRISCALKGVRTLLLSLTPCTATSPTGTCTAFDQVSLFTYPPVQANTAKYDTTCASGNASIKPYTLPTPGAPWTNTDFTTTATTYQLTGYLNDYLGNKKDTLNTGSSLTIAAGGSRSCSGIAAVGGVNTYFAGVIYAAQASLAAIQSNATESENAMIILSDGDATASATDQNPDRSVGNLTGTLTSTGLYPSYKDQCQQAVTAATYASNAGTEIYTIAYGASSSGCSSDKYNKTSNPTGSGITPCQTMQQMAMVGKSGNPAHFYSDATATQNNGQCVSTANPNLTLDQIFQKIQTQLTNVRLIPNGTGQ